MRLCPWSREAYVLPMILILSSTISLLASGSILLARVDASVNEALYDQASYLVTKANNCTVIFMHKIQNHIRDKGLDFQIEFGPNYLVSINESATVCDVRVTDVQSNPTSGSWQLGFQVNSKAPEPLFTTSGWIDIDPEGRLRVLSISPPKSILAN